MTTLHKKLERAKRAAEGLGLAQLRALDSYLHHLLAALEAAEEIPTKPGAEVLEERRAGGMTYRLQRVKCGKPGCKCADGSGHGPYWYAFSREGDRVKSKYIGKILKEEACKPAH